MSELKYLIAVVTGWFAAQFIKCVLHSIKEKNMNFIEVLFTSGGMPSSHTSVVISVSTLIGLTQGFDSAIFGLASAMALIIIYDSVKSRKSVGDQAEIIGHLIKEQGVGIQPPKIIRGHKMSEVLAGIVLGVAVGLAVFVLAR